MSVTKLQSNNNHLLFQARIKTKPSCPHCLSSGKLLRLKETKPRTIKHLMFGDQLTYLHVEVKKFLCRKCRKSFNQPIPGVRKWQRTSEKAKTDIALKHHLGISKKDLSTLFKLSHSTIERFYSLQHEKACRERKNTPCPRILGIDEHFLNKKTGYVTTLVNLQSHRVFDLLQGRSENALQSQLLKLKDRHRVQVIVMDMSSTYRSIAKKYFPNAMIVSDRFHVIRLINHELLKLWKRLDPRGRKNRGLISLIRRNRSKLNYKQQQKLLLYFKDKPALAHCYFELKKLQELLQTKTATQKQARLKLIPKLLDFIHRAMQTPLEEIQRLAKTIDSWKDPIARMWRFRKTNSITEGLHNKMELLQRRAYGFKRFDNYRTRVIALCG